MKIVIAPDSFKGSCSAVAVADSIEKGIKRVDAECDVVKIPIADGGEGTVEALVLSTGGTLRQKRVAGPLGDMVTAQYGILKNGVGVVELAAASGLTLIHEKLRDPWNTTTYGTGQLILAAIDDGCKKIVVGLGGSATNDGGMGIAQAFGVSFLDQDGKELGFGGGQLERLATINTENLDYQLKEREIIIACDVTNLLCGPEGASYIYGPQKGGTPEKVEALDLNLKHYAEVILKQLHTDVKDISGAGAAGGSAIPLLLFTNARIESGIKVILDITEIDKHFQNADLVITGEGRIDGQSIFRKVPVGVAARAKQYDLPVLAITGGIGKGAESCYKHGIDSIMSIVNGPMLLSEAMDKAEELTADAAERAFRIMRMGMNLKNSK
ncbi:MAG: glycerate kinase [Bacillota bacterium]